MAAIYLTEKSHASLDQNENNVMPVSKPVELRAEGSFLESPFWTCSNPVTVVVNDLTYVAPRTQLFSGFKFKSQDSSASKKLLDGVSLVARPGEVLAIVGPSGGGKTTLLNVLALRSPSSRVSSGSVTFNGHKETKSTIKSTVNYVMAHDKLLPYLTVDESIRCAAALKLPYLTEAERVSRIEKVVEDMQIQKCRNCYIGGEWRKGISTGELKRVAIAIELLDEPSVLILDEPTSGLDSSLSIKVMELLAKEARKGRTIICSVHQPSSQVFGLFDKLALVSLGRVQYFGIAGDALSYFSSLGYQSKKDWNPCDFLLDLISVRQSETLEQTKGLESHPPAGPISIGESWKRSDENRRLAATIQSVKANLRINSSRQTRHRRSQRWFSEFSTLWKRTSLNSLRNPLTMIVILLIQAMQGLVLGGIFFRPSTVETGPRPEAILSDSFWNSQWVGAYTFGLDNKGLRPSVEVFKKGLSVNESYILFDKFSEPFEWKMPLLSAIDHLSTCLYQRFDLKERGYSELPILEAPPVTDWENWAPERIYSNLMAFYQVFDYKYMDGDLHDHLDLGFMNRCLETSFGNSLVFYFCLMREAKPHIDTFLECASWPPLPTLGRRRLQDGEFSISGKPFSTSLNMSSDSTIRIEGDGKFEPKPVELSISNSSSINRMVNELIGPDLMQLISAGREWFIRITSCADPICVQLKKFTDIVITWGFDLIQTLISVLTLSACLFYVVIILGFASYDALLSFPQERALFNRETANGLYSTSSYYVAKNVADLPFQLVPCIMLTTIFYFMVGFDATAHQFFTYFAICVLISFCAYGFGYMVSSASPRMEIAILVAPLTLVLMLVLAGFFLRDADIPAWIGWFKYFSFYRWAFFSLVINQFPPAGYFGTLPNHVIWGLCGVTESKLGFCILWLFLLGAGYRILGYIFLANTNRSVGLEA